MRDASVKKNDIVLRRWLSGFAFLVALMVLVGGFVRLTRSGLSIVEWNPIHGALPPLSETAWEEEFAKYQQSPEYQKVNRGMTLDEYRTIFWIEWIHRQLARGIGLYYALPFIWFWIRKELPREHRGKLFAIGFLFIAQAIMGWLMVASGLVDQPAVSHFRLSAHLLLALSIVALSVWTVRALKTPQLEQLHWNRATKAVAVALSILTLQIIYGGMTAGLKAGYLSDTWPLMFGTLVPAGLFSFIEPAWLNLVEAPVTVLFIHRWLPVVGFLFIPLLWRRVRQHCGYTPEISRLLWGLVLMLVVQIMLGIVVVLTHVALPIALVHQGGSIVLVVLLTKLLYACAIIPREYDAAPTVNPAVTVLRQGA